MTWVLEKRGQSTGLGIILTKTTSPVNYLWFANYLTYEILGRMKRSRSSRVAKSTSSTVLGKNGSDYSPNRADIYVINHDGLKVIYKELLERKDITVLCIDELNAYRNNSDRTRLMKRFAKQFSTVWGLTGNPRPNAPTDIHHQVKIVTPARGVKTFKAAQEMLMTHLSQYVWKPKPGANEIAFDWMQPAVRFPLDAVTELPDAVTQPIHVDLSKQQEKVYNTVKKDLIAMIRDKKITALNAGAAMGKLLQISGGWVYTSSASICAT